MDISLQAPGEHNFVRSISAHGITIGQRTGNTTCRQSLILTADQLLTDWPPQRFGDLQPASLDALFRLQPELVLLGTGKKQQFPPADFMMEFYQRGIGIEVMATAPACRTFNVLVAESRKVLAALLPEI